MLFIVFTVIYGNIFAQQQINKLNTQGQKEGLWQTVSKAKRGDTLILTNYINNKKCGVCVKIVNNVVVEIKNYKNNVLEGWHYSYYRTGELELMIFYKNGKKHGKGTWYYEDGTIAAVLYWENNKPVNCHTLYNRDGTVNRKSYYKNNGNSYTIEYYYHNAGIRKTYTVENGKKEGKETLFDKEGNIIKSTIYKNGYPVAN